jgi:hypothetical protein
MSQPISVSIDLEPIDDGSFYRHSSSFDSPQMQRQQRNVLARGNPRGDSLTVQVDVVHIIHGTLSHENSCPATLVITEFRFISPKKSGHLQSAFINYRFADSRDSTSKGPVVVGISPMGSLSILPSKKGPESRRPLSVSSSSSFNFGSSAGGVLANVGVNITPGYSWDVVDDSMKPGGATLAGAIDVEGSRRGGANTATWALMEGDVEKNGIPNLLRTAILLRRDDQYEPFTATIEVDATADLAYEVRRLSGRTPKEMPVKFNIDLTGGGASGGFSSEIDSDNLEAVELKALSAVATARADGEGPKGRNPTVVELAARGGVVPSRTSSVSQYDTGLKSQAPWLLDSAARRAGSVSGGHYGAGPGDEASWVEDPSALSSLTISDNPYGTGPRGEDSRARSAVATTETASSSQWSDRSRGKAPRLHHLTTCADHMLQLLKRMFLEKVMGPVAEIGDRRTC